MKYRFIHTSLLMCLFVASCASQNVSAQDSPPEFRVRAGKAEDTIAVLDENSQTIFDIQSDFGIGSATVELVSGSMPDALRVRLHLRGLEDFQLISNQATVGASVASGEAGFPVSERIDSSIGELPILSVHPMWLKIETVSNSKKIPLDDGYFEITIPQEFLRKAGASFEIQWIDFFR